MFCELDFASIDFGRGRNLKQNRTIEKKEKLMERHFGPIGTVINLRSIIWKEGGLRSNYADIGNLARVVISAMEDLEKDERDGIMIYESSLQDVLRLHRNVMKLKEVRDNECRPCTAVKKKRFVIICPRCGFRKMS
jgi:hypothetical protein